MKVYVCIDTAEIKVFLNKIDAEDYARGLEEITIETHEVIE